MDWLIDTWVDWLIDWYIDWLIKGFTSTLMNWLVNQAMEWLIDWVIDWMIIRKTYSCRTKTGPNRGRRLGSGVVRSRRAIWKVVDGEAIFFARWLDRECARNGLRAIWGIPAGEMEEPRKSSGTKFSTSPHLPPPLARVSPSTSRRRRKERRSND